MKNHSLLWLVVFVSAPLVIGFLGSLSTMPAIPTWYATLAKPTLQPPNWIFGPVWTTLYLFMGIASYRVFMKRVQVPKLSRKALMVYGVHLIFNFLWSFAFFGLQSPLYGLVIIVPLLMLIVTTAILFRRIDSLSGILFLPYIAWVSFATYLNLSIFLLN